VDFSLVNPLNPVIESVLFTPTPPTVDVGDDAHVQTYPIQAIGTVGFPKGRSPWKLSFQAFLPGGARYGGVFAPVERWRPPPDLVYQLEAWQGNGTRLTFIVTDTEINKDVFITRFSRKWGSGYGDVPYTIELQEWRDVFIAITSMPTTIVPVGANVAATVDPDTGNVTGPTVPDRLERPDATSPTVPDRLERDTDPPPDSYTVKDGDMLYTIAQTQLGDGTRWTEIYDLNKDQISDPDSITSGMVLKMPTGTATQQPPPSPIAPTSTPGVNAAPSGGPNAPR
jgi:hypothetical protein